MQEAIVFACLMTVVMWLPYLSAAAIVRGPLSVLGGDPKADTKPMPAWATRLQQAHANATENLAAFVGVCVAANMSGSVTFTVTAVAFIYSFARIAHYLCYGMGIPLLRTVSFMVSWAATIFIGLRAVGLV
ncbi:MAG: hypothetical protein COA62_04940 [Rhodobiaceae bacterium]|nr:MAG: hypothetical protein COA62_04940 [Rhodobiaceae bacterium]